MFKLKFDHTCFSKMVSTSLDSKHIILSKFLWFLSRKINYYKILSKKFWFFSLLFGIVVEGTMVITTGKSKGETSLLRVVKVVSHGNIVIRTPLVDVVIIITK